MSWAVELMAEAERRRQVAASGDLVVERITRLAYRRATPLAVRLTWTARPRIPAAAPVASAPTAGGSAGCIGT